MRRQPKRTSYRKQMKGPIHGVSVSGGDGRGALKFGTLGLRAREPARLTARQLEAGRRVRRYHLKRAGKVWIRVFPDVPVSEKPLEVRMGKGKGSVSYWACKVRPGMMLFEVDGADRGVARHALRSSGKKFPMKTMLRERGQPLPMWSLEEVREETDECIEGGEGNEKKE